ncbi:hypothetical protein MPY17_07285 [Rhodococcus opacus]|uniref:hypothetical protein n=1 Tax=Rhodococcus opacus TaxID=37919 RepID=UPI001FF5436D|nr:hypothetical protein [Rhodococcus opacus]UOT05544.1 hypothetical protein MPY17_07285 [Rhodococcus opacus]
MRIGRLVTLIVIIWLLIGAVAVWQRGYFKDTTADCASAGTIAVTVIAGPLNYAGVNPKIDCEVPQPSQ